MSPTIPPTRNPAANGPLPRYQSAGGMDEGMLMLPQCMYCTRRVIPNGPTAQAPSCAAFPSAIPLDILRNQADHRFPYPGDDEATGVPTRFDPIDEAAAQAVIDMMGPAPNPEARDD